MRADFLIIGGGIAGLSAAARLARHGKAVVLEGEEALGYHASGRSVSFSHYGIGNAAVRGMTAWSRPFFEAPPAGFADAPIARTMSTLYFAGEAQLPALLALKAEMHAYTDAIETVDAARMAALCPLLRTGGEGAVQGLFDPTGLKLDAAAMLHGHAKAVRAAGGAVLTGRRVATVAPRDGWTVTTEGGETFSAPILVNAAGAWGDRIAALAGVAPLGLSPRRRTIIVIDPPEGVDASSWPFIHSAAGDFYLLPEAGQLLASPADEEEDDPCDAAPSDYDVALTAHRVEQYMDLAVRRVAHRWAGLRSFVADRTPTAGFDPQAPGFFWLIGQGGYGLQTSPAMAAIVEALVTHAAWPEGLAGRGVLPDAVRPERLRAAAVGSSHPAQPH
ncbi:MAG: NAD(P)/FAD-dependent oxidoreductase [Allosphingosinicella sp.]